MEQISRIGMDTSKRFFQVHGVNAAETVVLRKKLRRKAMVGFFEKLAPTVVGIEACGASHHWARLLQSFGHTVKLIPAQLVKPYVKRGKNDMADAEALCEAMSRPTMRFVPIKTADQQAALMLVGLRDRLIRNRTQLSNAIRGYAAEFGLTAANGLANLRPLLEHIQADEGVPDLARELFAAQAEEYTQLEEQIAEISAKLMAWHKADECSRRLAKIPGIGPIGAALLMMKTPAPELFRSGRQFAAWIGLTPRDHSTAGQVTPVIGIATIICIAIGAGAAGALNMWYDADIDALMTRTTARPIPSGRVSPKEALGFGLLTSATSVLALGSATNLEAAGLLAFTIFFYVVVYTAWLKRSTPQSIVIGGAAGAAAPVISWIAATGRLGLEPLLLFLIVFFWTPPHFWALSLNRSSDYRRAGIPVLPVVSGKDETTSQILIYTVLLLPVSLLPWLFGCAGIAYAAVTLASGTAMLLLALRLWRQDVARREAANRLFAFSICYVVLLFGTLLLERIILT